MKIGFLSVLCLLSCVSQASAEKGSKSMIQLEWKATSNLQKYYSYEGKVAGNINARIQLNGIDMQSSDGSGGSTSANYPQYFLLKGENQLSVEVTEIAVGSKIDDEAISVTFFALAEPGIPGKANEVISLAIRSSEIEIPFKRVYKFSSDNVSAASLIQQSSPVLVITSDDRRQIEDQVARVVEALKKSDFDGFFNVVSAAYKDQEECNHSDSGNVRSLAQKVFPRMAKSFATRDFDLSKIELVSALGGRVVFAQTSQGEPFVGGAFVTAKDTVRSEYKIPLGFSKINNTWLVTRTMGGVAPIPGLKIQKPITQAKEHESVPKPLGEDSIYAEIEALYAKSMGAEQARNVVSQIKNGYSTMTPDLRQQALSVLLGQLKAQQ